MAWGAWSQTFSPEVWSASQWGTKYYSINLNWRYRQDIAANQTQVEMISLRFNTLTSARGIHAATIHGRCSLANNDSAEKTCSNNMPSPPGSVTLAVNHTVTVTHNTDGSWPGHQVAWMLWVTGSGDSIQPNIRSFQCITTNIPKIPRTSPATVNVSTQTMGNGITISTNRASTEYKHTIYVKYSGDSSWGGAVASNVETSWTWTPAVSLAAKIPNASSGVWNILVRTMAGSTIIGDKIINVTLNVPSNIVPSISSVAVAEATAGIAAQFASYIQGRSTFKVTVAAAGNQGSTIKSYSVKADGKTYSGNSNVFTTQVINGSGSISVVATVTDSRGRTASKTVSVTVSAYSSPSIPTFKAVRCTSAGVEDEDGTAVKILFNFSIAAMGNKNTRSFKIQQLSGNTWTDIHTITDSYSTNSSIIKTGPFSVDSKFNFRAVAADFFTSATVYSDIAPSFALINFGASGKSIAFGMVSSNNKSMQFGLPIEHAHITSASGSYGYLKILTIKTQATAWNYGGLEFKYHCGARTMAFATGKIVINGGNTTDPQPEVITTDDPDNPIYLAKESANTWGVYVPKLRSEQAAVFDVVQYRIGAISWSFANVRVASLPSGYIKARWEYLNAMYPVGRFIGTVDNVNPGTRIGGTWVQFGQGRTLVGVGTGNDGSTSMTFTANSAGGKYNHTHLYGLESGEFYGSINLPLNLLNNGTTWQAATKNGSVSVSRPSSINAITVSSVDRYQNKANTGNNSVFPIPYQTVYFWRRTA